MNEFLKVRKKLSFSIFSLIILRLMTFLNIGMFLSTSESLCVSLQIENGMLKLEKSFLLEFIFNWRAIALQYCIGFCHTTT